MWTQHTTRLLSVVAVLLSLVGCGTTGKAPVETRGGDARYRPSATGQTIQGRFYKVKRGDTLYAIAWRANRDFRSLARWNNIKTPYVIYPGQILRLVPRGKATQARIAGTDSSTRRSRVEPRKATQKKQASSGPPNSSLRWSWPTSGPLLVGYSSSDPTRKGIKIGGKPGQAIRATEAGQVVYSGNGLLGYGRLVIIKHNDNYLSAYGHNAKLLVKEGDKINKGKQIATMGRSNEGKSMLHFEIRRDGKPVNPLSLLPRK